MKEYIKHFFTLKNFDLKYLLKIIFISFVTILFSEWLYRSDISNTLKWVLLNPGYAMMNLATLTFVIALFGALTKTKYMPTIGVFCVSILLSIVNALKFKLRNIPFEPSDVFLIKEVWALRESIFTHKTIVFILGFTLGMIVLAKLIKIWLKKSPFINVQKSFSFLCIISGIILLIGQLGFPGDRSIEKTGFIYSLSNESRPVNEYATLTDEMLEVQISEDILNYKNDESTQISGIKPNVVVIMSEAYWDINKMGLDFEKNPIDYFEGLRDESIYGELYVPVIGGGTVNTEYEVMTGMTLKSYRDDWYLVYPNEIHKPVPSLASVFRLQGYHSTGLHPYMSWYYNRLEVYKNFGFNDFYTLEYLSEDVKQGSYTKDAYTFSKILELIDQTEAPLFNYTVTIQNHGPYGDYRYTDEERNLPLITSLSDDANYFVNNYIQGLEYTDQALESFIEALRVSDEPTMVVYFGDHLPMLGDDYLAYREAGYIGTETNDMLQQDLRMMSVPYIIWKNYDATSENRGTMNASYLTPTIIEMAGLEMPDYLKGVSTIHDDLPIILRTYGLTTSFEKLTRDNPVYIANLGKYNKIKSKNELEAFEDSQKWIIADNEDYNKALNTVQIEDSVTIEGSTKISGGRFSQHMTLLIDDVLTEFVWKSDNLIVVEDPVESGSQLKLLLKDSENKVLAISNLFTAK